MTPPLVVPARSEPASTTLKYRHCPTFLYSITIVERDGFWMRRATTPLCVNVCVCVCARARARVCVRVCVCVHVCARVCV